MPINLSLIKKEKWEKVSSRKTTFHRYFDFLESGYDPSRIFGVRLNHGAFVIIDGQADLYFTQSDWRNFISGLEKFFQNSASIKFADKHMKADSENFIQWLKQNCNQDSIAKLSNPKLVKLLMQRHVKHLNLAAWQWFGFAGRHAMEDLLVDLLAKRSLEKNVLKIIFSFDHPIFVFEEEIKAKTMADQMRDGKLFGSKLEKALNDHISKYGHMVMYDETYMPMQLSHLKERVRKFARKKNLKKEIKDAYLELKKNKKDFDNLIKENKFSRKEKELILFAHNYAEYMELRNSYRGLAAKFSAPFFTEIGKRLDLGLRDLLSFTDYEVKSALLGKKKLTKKEARSRYEASALLHDEGRYFEARGKEALRIEKLLTPKLKLEEFHGTVANKGLVIGHAKIIYAMADIHKLKSGDVLVSPMTRPEFLSAIKKASAIVTDEGGMLCHAAIISRELNKPCIIGAKIGTRVLHDGDLVEVDANKGVVRILK